MKKVLAAILILVVMISAKQLFRPVYQKCIMVKYGPCPLGYYYSDEIETENGYYYVCCKFGY